MQLDNLGDLACKHSVEEMQVRSFTCRSGGNAVAGRAMIGPTSFRSGGSGRGVSSAMSAFISVSDCSRRAAADVRSMPCLRLIRQEEANKLVRSSAASYYYTGELLFASLSTASRLSICSAPAKVIVVL